MGTKYNKNRGMRTKKLTYLIELDEFDNSLFRKPHLREYYNFMKTEESDYKKIRFVQKEAIKKYPSKRRTKNTLIRLGTKITINELNDSKNIESFFKKDVTQGLHSGEFMWIFKRKYRLSDRINYVKI